MGDVLIGTSGYAYKDWENAFYPAGLDSRQYLEYYTRHFHTVEINATYYGFPNPYFFLNLAKKVPSGFLFSVKAHASMTHSRDASQGDYQRYRESVKVLQEQDKLGAVLFQFPYSFKPSIQSLDYIKRQRERLPDFAITVEFRNRLWMDPEVPGVLRESDIVFCNVDEPRLKGLMPPTAILSSQALSYIRFHGRNAANWYHHQAAYQRYDYAYSQEELKEWVPRIRKISAAVPRTFVYFNNHYKAQAVRSGQLLESLLFGTP